MIRKSPLLAAALAATLLALPSCTSTNDHLVFFTNTTFGVDLGTGPESGGTPKFLVGFERMEGVVDPLQSGYEFIAVESLSAEAAQRINDMRTQSKTGKTKAGQRAPGDTRQGSDVAKILEDVIAIEGGFLVKGAVRDQAHSVLAKLNFGVSSGSASAHNAQWFATGKAAIAMANNGNAASALTGENFGPAVKPVGNASSLSDLAFLTDAKNHAGTISTDPTHPRQKDAASALALIGAIDRKPYAMSFKVFSHSDHAAEMAAWAPAAAMGGFDLAISYTGSLQQSLNNLEGAIDFLAQQEGDAPDAADVDLEDGEVLLSTINVHEQWINQSKLLKSAKEALMSESAVRDLVALYKETR